MVQYISNNDQVEQGHPINSHVNENRSNIELGRIAFDIIDTAASKAHASQLIAITVEHLYRGHIAKMLSEEPRLMTFNEFRRAISLGSGPEK